MLNVSRRDFHVSWGEIFSRLAPMPHALAIVSRAQRRQEKAFPLFIHGSVYCKRLTATPFHDTSLREGPPNSLHRNQNVHTYTQVQSRKRQKSVLISKANPYRRLPMLSFFAMASYSISIRRRGSLSSLQNPPE